MDEAVVKKSKRRMFLMLFLAALLGLSCRFFSGSELSTRPGATRETVPGSSGRPAKTAESVGAATRTLAPPAGSSVMDPTTFNTAYTPAAPVLAPLALSAPDVTQQPLMQLELTAMPTPTLTLTPTVTQAGVTPFPTSTRPPSQPGQTATPSPTSGTVTATATATATFTVTATVTGTPPTATPTFTPTATSGSYPGSTYP